MATDGTNAQASDDQVGALREVVYELPLERLHAGAADAGHGHVYRRRDGVRARCGGPRVCQLCAADLAAAMDERAFGRPFVLSFSQDGRIVNGREIGAVGDAEARPVAALDDSTATRPCAVEAMMRVLAFIGYTGREARETAERYVTMLGAMTAGQATDPGVHLHKRFDGPDDDIVAVRRIEFASLCEHHLMPFTGHVSIAFLPAKCGKLPGLSKFARVVDGFAARLQLQERLTAQIADAVSLHTLARGVAVIVVASHSCLSCRGARKADAVMVTSAMRGLFRDDAAARAEVLRLLT